MSPYVLPVVYALFFWWFSTGVIIYLDGLARSTFKWTMAGATGLLVAALGGLVASSDDTSVAGAYLAFSCGLLVWAWQEVAFLLGYVTGPRRIACPKDVTGLRRAGFALQALLHHEMALIVLGLAVTLATWDGDNRTGLWTYMILWVMRQSAKINVFLGVRNLNEQFLPVHLSYLHSYFTRRSMNGFFPVCIVISTLCTVWLWQAALSDGQTAAQQTALTFAAALLSLAVIEHWFLVVPLRFEVLWQWGMRSRVGRDAKQLGPKAL